MKVCRVDGCDNKEYAKGYCKKHYVQIKRHGKISKRTHLDPNEIIINGNIAEIVLYDQKCEEKARAIVDAEDVKKVKGYKWHLSPNGYVITSRNKNIINLSHKIMGVKSNKKLFIDHKNRNPLINLKLNLRLCTNKENLRNRGKHKRNTSGYKGVIKNGNKWRAKIGVNERSIHLGIFKDKNRAAQAYNEASIKHFGEFACLNKI